MAHASSNGLVTAWELGLRCPGWLQASGTCFREPHNEHYGKLWFRRGFDMLEPTCSNQLDLLVPIAALRRQSTLLSEQQNGARSTQSHETAARSRRGQRSIDGMVLEGMEPLHTRSRRTSMRDLQGGGQRTGPPHLSTYRTARSQVRSRQWHHVVQKVSRQAARDIQWSTCTGGAFECSRRRRPGLHRRSL